MTSPREPSTEEEELIRRLSELLDPADAGIHVCSEGANVLLYTMIPTAELPAGIIGTSAYWLCQIFMGPSGLARLVQLLSDAVKQWLTERSKGVPLVA